MREGAAEMWFGFIVDGPWRFIIIAAIVALIAAAAAISWKR